HPAPVVVAERRLRLTILTGTLPIVLLALVVVPEHPLAGNFLVRKPDGHRDFTHFHRSPPGRYTRQAPLTPPGPLAGLTQPGLLDGCRPRCTGHTALRSRQPGRRPPCRGSTACRRSIRVWAFQSPSRL